ncbi:DUF397 domain-containing protein [Spirillospora sp. NPDC127200]
MTVTKWRKSSYSDQGGGTCVELAALRTAIGLRDSKNPGQGHIVLPRESLAAVLRDIKAGRYEPLEDV